MSTGPIETTIAKFLFHQHLTPTTTTGNAPAELLLGRHPRSLLDVVRPDLSKTVWHSIRKLRNSVMMITPQWEVLKLEIQCLGTTSAHRILIWNGCLVRFVPFVDLCPTLLSCTIIESSVDTSITSVVVHRLSHWLRRSPSQTPPKTFLMTWPFRWPASCNPLTLRLSHTPPEPADSLIGGFQLKERGDVASSCGLQRVIDLWPDLSL